ncbi:hypothetical protein EDB92DRAFT_942410 [Lactarius akahatsu]|uniref:BRCT domain-containing protein n=1 Tax=Lactarius akahatsu TaxID=416441 RepID=A0AAD4QEM5_9AGAM|nr:hypothetical protein EDB92DRAFT_942410 [Lactarius akahatsu]
MNSENLTQNQSHRKERLQRRYNPYLLKDTSGGSKTKSLTRHLLQTLTEDSNPITHSDIGLRSDHVVSLATGHQKPDGPSHRRVYVKERNAKLRDQREEATSNVLSNTSIYINGYLRGTTDIEMKRVITEAGGQVLQSASNATHIVSSQPLSGTKTQNLLKSSSRTKQYVVKPEWVMESISAGRRLREESYKLTRGDARDVVL